MTPFRERNPVPIGAIGLAVIAGLFLVTFNLNKFGFVTRRSTFHAELPETGGLEKGNDVRVAGVRVGGVTDMRLEGRHVVVAFTVSRSVPLGDQTRVAVKLRTFLGTKFLEITPAGAGRLRAGARIPLERSSVPLQIYDAFKGLATTLDEIDTTQLAKALDVLADTLRDTKGNAREALSGLATLSRTVAARDDELRDLLGGMREVTGALAARDTELARLVTDADLVLQVIRQRREAIDALLRDTSRLAVQLTSLVKDNRAQIDPLLRNLHEVIEVLKANLGSLDQAVSRLGTTSRYLTNLGGNGTWLDVYSENVVISDEMLCALGAC